MPLVTSKDFQLTPDVSPLTQTLTRAIMQKAQMEQQDEQLAQKQQAEQVKTDLATTSAQLLRVRDIKDNATQRREIAKLGQERIRQGKDPSVYNEALNITNPDEMNLYLTRNALKGDTAKKFLEERIKATDRFEPVYRDGKIVAQKNITTGEVIKDPSLVQVEGQEVQSSKILDSGAVQVVYKDGTTEVKEVDQTQKDIIKRAEERGVDLQQRRAQGRGLGKDAAKVASETFKRVGSLRANNRSLQKVIREVAAGAETGPLSSRLPSMREASVKLDQVRSELGLDVVGSVTFGALSEGELNLALSTALPTKLEGPALAQWAREKIQAQEKLANYLEDQAIFLSEKGNTPAMWLQKQRELAPKTTEQPTGQPQAAPQTKAPPAAINYLMQNNTPEIRKAFQAKYGYLPEGM